MKARVTIKKPLPSTIRAARSGPLGKFTPEQVEKLRAYFDKPLHGNSWSKFCQWVKAETGISISQRRQSNISFALFGNVYPWKWQREAHLNILTDAETEEIVRWWLEDPLITYERMRDRIHDTFGKTKSISAIGGLFHDRIQPVLHLKKDGAPPPAPGQEKTVELSVVVREGDKVQGTTTLRLPLKTPEAGQ